jgi:hypothetical protein
MKKIIVIDLEVNKEFELIDLHLDEDKVVIRNDEYGFCSQDLSKIKFTNSHLELDKNSANDKDFAEWIGKNNYQLVHIYSKYIMDDCDREVYPDYETFVASKWTTCDEIPEIMVDNNNEELEWCLANSYTTEELYDLFLKK